MKRTTRFIVFRLLGLAAMLFMLSCSAGNAPNFPSEAESTPAEDSIGERLFLDTRFAQFFATHMTGVNQPLPAGDPAVDFGLYDEWNSARSVRGPIHQLPFLPLRHRIPRRCRSGNRTYAEYTTRSLLPRVLNTFDHTPGNSMQMVGSLQPRPGPVFLHFDGEFTDPVDLVETTLTGRNFGWAPDQHDQAVAHIAAIIRGDDGSDQLAKDRTHGLSYSKLFLGKDSGIPSDVLIPAADRIDVNTASGQQILALVAKCISTYMGDLRFQHDEFGRFMGSPYDVFLRVNHLPVQPNGGETIPQYNQRLAKILDGLTNPIFVDGKYGAFQYHDQPFQFGATELAGLKIFLKAANGATDGSQHAGNCAACHQAPNFSDFSFHNTGASQEEYDAANGAGAFASLAVPSKADRDQNYDLYLPVTVSHPNASERFRHAAVAPAPLSPPSAFGIFPLPRPNQTQNPKSKTKLAKPRGLFRGPGLGQHHRVFQDSNLARPRRLRPLLLQWQQGPVQRCD